MKKQPKQEIQTAIQFFGYRYPPFSDTFEINEPFQSPSEELITQRTIALLSQGKSIVLYGEAGTGKSMLVKAICSELDSKAFRTALVPFGGIKPQPLLREICDQLDIDASGRKNLLSKLSSDFQRSSEKPYPIIIVDEAHEMQRQSFLDLCSLLHDARRRTAAASLILVGQPVLKKMLELDIFAPVKTRIATSFAMPKLNQEEAKAFLLYRCGLAQTSAQLFDTDALECLAADAKGNRRILMNIAALCLEEAARRKEKIVTAEIVTNVSLELNN